MLLGGSGIARPLTLVLAAGMRILIDPKLCTGHGRCYVLSPALFVDDERGYGQVIGDGTVDTSQQADATRAVEGCPEQAISVVGSPG